MGSHRPQPRSEDETVSDATDRRHNKRASFVLALLLAVLAVILTIIALGPGDRRPRTAPPPAGPTALPSVPSSPSPADATPGAIGGGTGGGGAAGGGGSSGVVCTVGSVSVACPQGFTIAGDASGLYPGGTVELPLTLDNPYAEDIRVTSITVSVTGTSAPSCAASNLHTPDYEGPGIIVPAHGASSLSLAVSLSRSAPDGCQNVTFTLWYAGKAESA